MKNNVNLIALQTLVTKEIRRFMRIWVQTLIPPAITMILYFVIFGHLVGRRIGIMGGVDYMQYIVPGLIMMSVITNAYSNVVSSFYSGKFQHNIEELLVAPISSWVIITGYVLGGVTRGLLVGAIVTILSLFFTQLHIEHFGITFMILLLTSILFSLGGFINAVYANSFDDISIVPTFVLTPLTYLGGVFYSMDLLPSIWQKISLLNPIVYMINGFRYGILGVSDVRPEIALLVVFLFAMGLLGWAWYLLSKGIGLRS